MVNEEVIVPSALEIRRRMEAELVNPPWGEFQVEGVRFLMEHGGRALLGDEQGLGKSFQAIAYTKLNPDSLPVVVICPATVKYQWKREFWRHARLKSTVLSGFKRYRALILIWKKKRGKGKPIRSLRRFTSNAKREEFLSDHDHRIRLLRKFRISYPPLKDIVIVNYDILEDWAEYLIRKYRFTTMVVDECQKLQGISTKRTQYCKVMSKHAERVIALSGTPITSSPIQFFPILNMLRPRKFKSRMKYAIRFCDPKRGWRPFDWDLSGADNLDVLHRLLKNIMLRRMQKDVLKDLPDITRVIIPVELSNRKEYLRARDDFIVWLTRKKGSAAAERAKGAEAICRLGELKRLCAKGKLPVVVQWIRDWLDAKNGKLVVFFIHRVISEQLRKEFPNAAFIDGSVSMKQRQEAMDRFQKNPKCTLLLGQLDAAGVGTNLTASHATATIELGWTPAAHAQAEKRVHRIGQTSDKVLAYYFLSERTVEEDIWSLLDRKRDIVNQILDGGKSLPGLVIKKMLMRSRKRDKLQ